MGPLAWDGLASLWLIQLKHLLVYELLLTLPPFSCAGKAVLLLADAHKAPDFLFAHCIVSGPL